MITLGIIIMGIGCVVIISAIFYLLNKKFDEMVYEREVKERLERYCEWKS